MVIGVKILLGLALITVIVIWIFSLATENMRGLFLVTIISVALILEGSYGILNEEQIKE